MQEMVKNIVERELNTQAISVEEIVGKGKNNLVFKIVTNENTCILRLKHSQKELQTYQKEKWCSELAKKAGIPTPKILKVGMCGEYSFSFQEYIDGVDGNDAEDKTKIWYTLGQYAKIINSIPAEDLTLDYKLFIQELFDGNFFVTKGIFSQVVSSRIKERLEETIGWKFSPKLCHRNLNPSNVVLSTEGIIHLIDWENATGSCAPLSELGEIYTWNTGKENISQFVAGYGLREKEVMGMMRDIQTLVLLRLLEVIRRKVLKSDEWKVDTYIQETSKMITEIQNYQEDVLFTKNL
ncbi:MAG: aminoglycoside phosphotransferase family protein [Minisyncoccia bacterium]